jgi:hypothetical protein
MTGVTQLCSVWTGYSITRTNLPTVNWHVGKHVASMWDKTMLNIHGCKQRENGNVAKKCIM